MVNPNQSLVWHHQKQNPPPNINYDGCCFHPPKISPLSLRQLSLFTATDIDPRLLPFASRGGVGGGNDRTSI